MNGTERVPRFGTGWRFFSLSLVVVLTACSAVIPALLVVIPPAQPTPLPTTAPPPPDLSQVDPIPFDAQMQAELEDYVATLMEREQAPGVAVSIVQPVLADRPGDGEVVYQAGFGVRELGTDRPVTPETLMMIGSTGKSMTTMMMGTVVDDGLMAWDTPATDVYPDFAVSDPNLTPQITMRHLVCNCTGVERRDIELFFPNAPDTAEGVIESLRTFSFTGEFGLSFQYSNQMVAAGGYLAARAATAEPGDLMDDYLTQMQQRVFDPIGMDRTTFSIEEAQSDRNHATPHGWTADLQLFAVPLSFEQPLQVVAPAGTSWSNVQDLARYLITQLSQGVAPDGERVISAENLTETWRPQVQTAPDTSYALGWAVTGFHGTPLLNHGGGTAGFSSGLTFLPEADLGVAVLTNAQASPIPIALTIRALELAYGLPMEADATFAAQTAQRRQMIVDQIAQLPPGLDVDAVAPYEGAYTNPSLGEVTLSLEDDAFLLDAGPFASELRWAGNDLYLVWDPPLVGLQVRLSQDEAGMPRMELISTDPDQPETYVFARVAEP